MLRALSSLETDDHFRRRSRWTTAKRLTSLLNVILILSDSQYKGWQPEKDDLLDIQMGLLYFTDKYGRLSLKEAQWLEEEGEVGSDSHGPSSFENTPSPQSVPSVERSTSGSSSTHPSAESPSSTEGDAPIRTSLKATAVGGITQPAAHKPWPVPRPNKAAGPPESAGRTAAQPGIVPGKTRGLGGPPQPDERFFNNPLNLRTIMTGTGDGYRSPEPPSRLDTLSPLHHLHKGYPILGGNLTVPGQSSLGMTAERLGTSTVTQPIATQPPPNDPDPGIGHRYGPPPPSSNSLVLPVELMAYNDLMMDIGAAQYLGTEIQESGPPPFAHPPVPMNDGWGDNDSGSSTSGYRGPGPFCNVMHESPQTVPSFGYPQQGQQYCGGHAPAQQTHANYGGRLPTGGIVDYK